MILDILYVISLIGALVLLYVWFYRVAEKEMKQETEYEIWSMYSNQLQRCKVCRRYSRVYQQQLLILHEALKGKKRFSDRDRICPHCHNDDFFKMDKVKKHSWLKKHPDCPELNFREYRQLKPIIEEGRRVLYEMESLDAFKNTTDSIKGR